MRTLGHLLAYLSLGVWLGALFFFGAILAPLAFSQLPPLFADPAQGMHAAGVVVGGSLVRLHWMGLVCGLVFLAAMLIARVHFRTIIPQTVLVLLMMVITCYSQFSVIPRMDTARNSVGGNVDAVPADNPGRKSSRISIHAPSIWRWSSYSADSWLWGRPRISPGTRPCLACRTSSF